MGVLDCRSQFEVRVWLDGVLERNKLEPVLVLAQKAERLGKQRHQLPSGPHLRSPHRNDKAEAAAPVITHVGQGGIAPISSGISGQNVGSYLEQIRQQVGEVGQELAADVPKSQADIAIGISMSEVITRELEVEPLAPDTDLVHLVATQHEVLMHRRLVAVAARVESCRTRQPRNARSPSASGDPRRPPWSYHSAEKSWTIRAVSMQWSSSADLNALSWLSERKRSVRPTWLASSRPR